jgi:signal transduction histidine kinase
LGKSLKSFTAIKFENSSVYQNFLMLMRLASAFVLVVSLGIQSNAQNKTLDSLNLLLPNSKGTERVDLLYEISYNLILVAGNDRALELADESLNLAAEAGDSLRMVKAILVKGSALRRLERLNEAIQVSTFGLKIAKRNGYKSEVKILLNSIGLAHTFNANYGNALDYLFESLVVREAEGNKQEISIALNNIGFVYFKIKDYEKAIEYYTRSLKLKREVNDNYDLDRLLINIGLCYNQIKGDQSKFVKAQKYIQEALEVCGSGCSEPIRIEANFGLGVSYFQLDDLDNSRNHFTISLNVARKAANKRFQAENLVYLSQISLKQKNFKEALVFLTESEKLSIDAGYNQLLIDTYKQFSKLYSQTEDFKNATAYQEKYIDLKDSLISEDLVKNIAQIQTNYAERENIKTIADKEDQIQRQRSLGFAIVVIAILASLLIFVLYRSNRVKKRVNQALSDAKAIIEDQNRQLMSSNYNLDKELKEKNIELEKANESLLRVNEELDNFIYKTSHDIRGPLASLKGMCNVALMDVKDQLALNYLKKLDITAEKLNTILTRLLIVNQINNSALGSEKIDFDGIVGDVLMLEKKKGLPPRLKIKKHIDDAIEFYSDKEFVRIILENLIDNAIKFYNDSERIEPFVDISVTEEADYVKIKVVDNGIGISEVHPDKIFQMFSRASERSETGGIGLYITKTATEKLGGSVHLKTTPEGYTEFFVTLPFSSSKVLA